MRAKPVSGAATPPTSIRLNPPPTYKKLPRTAMVRITPLAFISTSKDESTSPVTGSMKAIPSVPETELTLENSPARIIWSPYASMSYTVPFG